MGWKEKLLKLNGKMTREKWLLFLLAGVFLMLLSVPGGEKKTVKEDRPEERRTGSGDGRTQFGFMGYQQLFFFALL